MKLYYLLLSVLFLLILIGCEQNRMIQPNINYEKAVYYAELFNYSSGGYLFAFSEGSGVYHNLTNLSVGSIKGFNYSIGEQAEGGSELIVTKTGNYSIDFSISFAGSASGGQYGISVTQNYNPSMHRECYSRRAGTGNAGSASIDCIISAEVGDIINVQFEDESTPVKDVTIYTATLNIEKIDD